MDQPTISPAPPDSWLAWCEQRQHWGVTQPIVYKRAGADDAAAIGLFWAMAEARRTGEAIPREVEDSAVAALQERLADAGARAVLGWDGEEPVVACFGTQAVSDGQAVAGRAHVSGVSVHPDRWGEGLATGALRHLDEVLANAGYVKAQLHVLETNARARTLYEHLGWKLVRLGEAHVLGPHAVYEKELRRRAE